jgi:hypothetical protein
MKIKSITIRDEVGEISRTVSYELQDQRDELLLLYDDLMDPMFITEQAFRLFVLQERFNAAMDEVDRREKAAAAAAEPTSTETAAKVDKEANGKARKTTAKRRS